MTNRCGWMIALLAGAVLLAGCGNAAKEDAQEVGERAGAMWDSIKKFTVNQKNEAMAAIKKQMDAMPERMRKAREAASGLSDDAKKALDGKWEAVQEAYEATKNTTGEKWQAAKERLHKAYEDLKSSMAERGATLE